jgi:chromosome segregation ATPase
VSDPQILYPAPPPAGSGVKTALVAGALVALLASNIYLYVQVDHARTDIGKVRESMITELTNLRETSSVTSASNRRHIETLQEELAAARKQVVASSAQSKAESQARVDALAKRLADAQTREQQRVNAELAANKEATTAAQAKIAEVNTDVGGVKTELGSTKSELQKTISDLKSVRGDMGVQSGLIATNGKELDALKRLGERNYFEFKLGKTKQPQRVGDITLQLKKSDPKRNKFTVDVMADDKKYEKKDKNVNEPVQFYTAKARQPYEIVVNQIGKDLIVGYLATPKETISRQ